MEDNVLRLMEMTLDSERGKGEEISFLWTN